jgi:hypothetical protein
MLGIKEKELDMMFRIFHEIDVHSAGRKTFLFYQMYLTMIKLLGSIQPIELFTYVNVELGSFEKNIFDVLDAGMLGSHVLISNASYNSL